MKLSGIERAIRSEVIDLLESVNGQTLGDDAIEDRADELLMYLRDAGWFGID